MKKKTTFFRKFSRVFAAFLMVPALSFVAASCSDDDDNTTDPNEIKDLPGSVTLAAGEAENTATLKFTAGLAWEAAYANEDSKWFSFSPVSGTAGNITINITAPYNEGAAKTGKLTIKHGTKTYDVTINQSVGKPDLAQWEKDSILLRELAPDPYNATGDTPITFTFKIKTTQDYETAEEAPFQILAFETDENYKPTTTPAEWVKFNLTEEPSVAKEGKVWQVTVDTIAINWEAPLDGKDRIAYVCIVPQGTKAEDMFTDGSMKEEFLEMGTTLLQQYYKVNMEINPASAMIMMSDMPTTPITELKPWEANYTANCKLKALYTPQPQNAGPEGWFEVVFENGKARLNYLKTLEELRQTSMVMHAYTINFAIDRGERLPIATMTPPYVGFPLTISYIHL